jgi:hypothetical protein
LRVPEFPYLFNPLVEQIFVHKQYLVMWWSMAG